MIADMLTKSLPKIKHVKCVELLHLKGAKVISSHPGLRYMRNINEITRRTVKICKATTHR